MSPLAAEMFTCVTSLEEKRACSSMTYFEPKTVRQLRIGCRNNSVDARQTWWGRTSDSPILSATSAYPLRETYALRGAVRRAV